MSQADPSGGLSERPSTGALLVEQMSEAAGRRERKRDLRPLGRLIPFAMAHKADLLLSLIFLVLATIASLSLTVAARGAIDHGFEDGGAQIDRWFLLLGANALFLAAVTAARYF